MHSTTGNLAVAETREPTPLRARSRGAFFEGPSARQMLSVLAYAHAWGKMGLVAASPGLGKTSSARHFTQSFPSHVVWHFEANPCTRTTFQALRGLSRTLGIETKPGHAGLDLWKLVCDRVVGQNALIIVDEAQHLKLEALEMLRSIHDATNVGLVLLGAADLDAKVMSHAPLSSRVCGARCYLSKHQQRDVEELAASWGVKDARIVDALKKLADSAGALRIASEAMTIASARARGSVTFEAVRDAAKVLGKEVAA